MKMLLLCLFAVLVSVHCAPRNSNDVLENMRFHNRSHAGNVHMAYTFHQDVSGDVRSIIRNQISYLEENTCLRFEEKESIDTTDSKYFLVFLKAKKTVEGCFDFLVSQRDDGGYFFTIKLNEECVRQTNGIDYPDYVDRINNSYCKI